MNDELLQTIFWVRSVRPDAELRVSDTELYRIFDGDKQISPACIAPDTAWYKAEQFIRNNNR